MSSLDEKLKGAAAKIEADYKRETGSQNVNGWLAIANIRLVGSRMANACFNFSQKSFNPTDSDRATLKHLQRQWDHWSGVLYGYSVGETPAPSGDDRECQCFNECVCGKGELTASTGERIFSVEKTGGVEVVRPYAVEVAVELIKILSERISYKEGEDQSLSIEETELKTTAAKLLTKWLQSCEWVEDKTPI